MSEDTTVDEMRREFIELVSDPLMQQALTTAVWALRVHHVAMMLATTMAEDRIKTKVEPDSCVKTIRSIVHKKAVAEPYMLQGLPFQYGDCVAGFLQRLIAQEADGAVLDSGGLAKLQPPVEFTLRGESKVVPVGSCLMLNGQDPLLISAYLHALYYFASENGYGVIYLTNDRELENTMTGTVLPPSAWHNMLDNRTRLTNLLMGVTGQRGHTCQLLLVDNLTQGAGSFIGRSDVYCIKEALQTVKNAAASLGAAVVGGAIQINDSADVLAAELRTLTASLNDQYMEFNHATNDPILGGDESVEEQRAPAEAEVQQELEAGDVRGEAG